MLDEPDRLYGADVGSSYQGQETMLSKHFAEHATGGPQGSHVSADPDAVQLFDDMR
jgi:hypothetical protein